MNDVHQEQERGSGPSGDYASAELLDLRQGGSLPAHLLRRLDELAAREYGAFNRLIGDLSQKRERNIDWWVSRPATRNNHASALPTQCLQLTLVRQLLDEGKSVVVKVDSPEAAAVLRNGGGPRLHVIATGRWRISLSRTRQVLKDITSSIYHCLGAAMAARLTRGAARPLSAEPITLIDTFVLRDSFAGTQFRDRYYPGLLDMLPATDRAAIYYVPTYYRERHYLSTIRRLRRDRANFIIREDHLGFADYAFAFGHWLRARRLLGTQAQFAGFEIGPLVDADFRYGRFASIVVRSLLAYRFLVAAPRRGLRIRCILDWYEGLDLNHAIAAAVNWHGSQTQLIGVRPACSALYMSTIPAPHEVSSGVVPRTFAVVGTRTAADVGALCPGLRIVPSAGLRYGPFVSMQRRRTEFGGSVLLTLPLWPVLACQSLEIIEQSRRLLPHGPARWWVKGHPALSRVELLSMLGGGLPDGFELVEGDFREWLVRSDVVVSVASSALIEAAALGVPTVCLALGNAPTEIPLPDWVDRGLRYIAYDAQEAADAIARATSAPQSSTDCTNLKDSLLGLSEWQAIPMLLRGSDRP